MKRGRRKMLIMVKAVKMNVLGLDSEQSSRKAWREESEELREELTDICLPRKRETEIKNTEKV